MVSGSSLQRWPPSRVLSLSLSDLNGIFYDPIEDCVHGQCLAGQYDQVVLAFFHQQRVVEGIRRRIEGQRTFVLWVLLDLKYGIESDIDGLKWGRILIDNYLRGGFERFKE